MLLTRKWLFILAVCVFSLAMILPGCRDGNDDPGNIAANGNEGIGASSGDGSIVEPTALNGQGTSQGAAQGQIKVKTPEPLNISYFSNYDSKSQRTWDSQNPVLKWLKEYKGVTVTEIGAGAHAEDKLNSLAESGQLPDLIQTDRGTELNKLIKEKKLVALDDYLNKYPNIRMQVSEETLNMLRSDDGKLYMLPNWFISATGRGKGTNGYVINRKIYSELGSPKLVTFDDLENYLKQVRESYPDVLPLAISPSSHSGDAAQQIFYTGFAEGRIPEMTSPDGIAAFPDEDALASIFTDAAFQDSTVYVSKLYREGLLTDESLSMSKEQLEQKLAQGKAAVYVGYDILDAAGKADQLLRAKDEAAGYEVIWPLRADEDIDLNHIYPSSYDSTGWNVVAISKNSENPERIYQFLDWSVTKEATRIYQYGPSGLLWDRVDNAGAPIPNEKYRKTTQKELAAMKLGEYALLGNYSDRESLEYARELMLPRETRKWDVMAANRVTNITSLDRLEFENLTPKSDSEEGKIAKEIRQLMVQLAMDTKKADSDEEVRSLIEQADKDAEQADYDKLLGWKTERWQANLDRMSGK